ncbi:MAG: hypothetical protein EI684_19405 [Candidatus Viridilinea halotolerans]|uniref:Restriction endonuclease subunit R n=1 Tax=Candidatus Viridilinea halotolerans TaxID=2491704 RepID=A0A426TST0_9CHLR|nr:MAG: hypothetical protein EI684_19405 [Candidatus Viridilinea halotolerans]
MAYSDFTLQEAVRRFQLHLHEAHDLFAPVVELEPSPLLRATLAEQIPLALAIQTEKARSELIIVPILVEMRRHLERSISLFSGIEFNVDPAQGLNGICDYIISQSHEQFYIQAPVMAVVEAKNENIKAGLGQCAAALVAAQRFNERENTGITRVYGVVTTGNIWRFLKLDGTLLYVDQVEYYVDRVGAILAILNRMACEPIADNQ